MTVNSQHRCMTLTCLSPFPHYRSGAAGLLPSSAHTPQSYPAPMERIQMTNNRINNQNHNQGTTGQSTPELLQRPAKAFWFWYSPQGLLSCSSSVPLWSSVGTRWPQRSSWGTARRCIRRSLWAPTHRPCTSHGQRQQRIIFNACESVY